MSAVLADEFRGDAESLLSDHAPNAGAAWHIAAGVAPELDGNPEGNATEWLFTAGVFVPDSAAVVIPSAGTAAALSSADCSVSGAVRRPGLYAGQTIGLVARWNGTDTWYELNYDPLLDNVNLGKWIAGVFTSLQDWSTGVNDGDAIALKLTLVGTALTVTIGDSVKAPVVDAGIAAAGRSGFRHINAAPNAFPAVLRLEQFLATL